MMNTIKKMAFAGMFLILAGACKKEGDLVTVSTGDVPALASSATTVALNKESEELGALTFEWNEYQVSWSNDAVATDVTNYTLQISRAGNNFQNVLLSRDTEARAVTFTHKEINEALIAAQIEPGTTTDLEARLRISLAANRNEYTNTINLQITGYEDIVALPTLYLAGGFNGWSHSEDFRVVSFNHDDNYEGYVNFADPDTEFKFSSVAGWDGTNYGDGGDNNLDTDGGAGNLQVADAGYYLLKANIADLNWSATKTDWGMIGDAIGGWGDGDDIALAYDAETRTLRAEVAMSPGPWKFRANGGWDINLGGGDQPGALAYGGSDFNLEVGGTYLVILDLSNPDQYSYSIELL